MERPATPEEETEAERVKRKYPDTDATESTGTVESAATVEDTSEAEDDPTDLDLAHARRVLAEEATAPPPSRTSTPCRCDRPRPERGLDDDLTCGKCGRALPEGS